MRSLFTLADQSVVIITTVHPAQAVCIEKFNPSGTLQASFHVPAVMAGVISQALAATGQAVETGPCRGMPPFRVLSA